MYEISKLKFKQRDVVRKRHITCPVCGTDDVIIEKGDGERIIGLDIIALHCNICKKIYEFDDVVYADED